MDVATPVRWDQLLRYGALQLGAALGEDVSIVLSRAHQDPAARQRDLMEQLTADGVLTGALRVPNTVGDMEILADLRARQLQVTVEVLAPQDKQRRGRIGWLLRQLGDAPDQAIIEAWPKNARTCPTQRALSPVEVEPHDTDGPKSPSFVHRLELMLASGGVAGSRMRRKRGHGAMERHLVGQEGRYAPLFAGRLTWCAGCSGPDRLRGGKATTTEGSTPLASVSVSTADSPYMAYLGSLHSRFSLPGAVSAGWSRVSSGQRPAT